MTSNVILQPPASRQECLKTKLFQLSWKRGVSNFFLEDIPFGYSTSQDYVNQLLQSIQIFHDSTPKETYHLFELGAGFGVFSKQLLDVAKKAYPELYPRLFIHVTDASSELIQNAKQSQLFNEHKDKVEFEVLDFFNPTFSTAPDFLVLSYLFDSLPARHIEVKDGQIYELLVQSTLSKEAVIADCSTLPPKSLTFQKIKDLILSEEENALLPLLSPLSLAIEESWHPTPIEQSTLSEKERSFLESYTSKIKSETPYQFNFNFDALHAFQSILSKLPESALVFVLDFGDSIPNPNFSYSHLLGRFGACTFLNVYFPLLIDASPDFSPLLTNYPSGHSQLLALYKGPALKTLAKQFNRTHQFEGGTPVQSALNQLKQFPDDPTYFQDQAPKLLSQLTVYEKQSHTLLLSLAIQAYKLNLFEDSLGYCQSVLVQYGDLALSTLHLMAKIYFDQGNMEKSLSVLARILDQSPYYFEAHFLNSLIFLRLGDRKSFLNSASLYLRYCHTSDKWGHFLTFAMIMIETEDEDMGKSCLNWVVEHPKIVSKSISTKALGILDLFKSA